MTLYADNVTKTNRLSNLTPTPGNQKLRYWVRPESNTATQLVPASIIPEHSSGTKRNDLFGLINATYTEWTRIETVDTLTPNYILDFGIALSQSQLIEKYISGEMDIPDIASYLGKEWNLGMVVLWLEQNNVHRPLSMQKMSSSEKKNILNKLVNMRGTPKIQELNTDEWIDREVVASQRIESVYVNPKH